MKPIVYNNYVFRPTVADEAIAKLEILLNKNADPEKIQQAMQPYIITAISKVVNEPTKNVAYEKEPTIKVGVNLKETVTKVTEKVENLSEKAIRKLKALEIIDSMVKQNKGNSDIIKRLMKDLDMSYANGFYYLTKVYQKSS